MFNYDGSVVCLDIFSHLSLSTSLTPTPQVSPSLFKQRSVFLGAQRMRWHDKGNMKR